MIETSLEKPADLACKKTEEQPGKEPLIEYATLNNGIKMPQRGFETSLKIKVNHGKDS